jgi:hypothetical protein
MSSHCVPLPSARAGKLRGSRLGVVRELTLLSLPPSQSPHEPSDTNFAKLRAFIIAQQAPWASVGGMAWVASPMMAMRPTDHQSRRVVS